MDNNNFVARRVRRAGLAILIVAFALPAWGAPSGQAGDLPVRPQPDSALGRLLARAEATFSSGQAVVVRATAADNSHALLGRYEKTGDGWRRIGNPVPAVLGVNGITLEKREGDGKSPAGIFPLGRAFGSEQPPSDFRMPYTRTTRYDYWVDDPKSADYNRWVTTFQDPRRYWQSFEKLNIPEYRYAAVIDYNTQPIVPGRGSAIFLHIWPGPNGHTVGCTAIAERHLVVLLRWLNPAERPVIIQGTTTQLNQLAANSK